MVSGTCLHAVKIFLAFSVTACIEQRYSAWQADNHLMESRGLLVSLWTCKTDLVTILTDGVHAVLYSHFAFKVPRQI